MSSEKQEFVSTKLDLCIFDEDNTPESKALVKYLKKSNNTVELEGDDVIMDALYYETVDCVLTINKGYSKELSHKDAGELFTTRYVHESYALAQLGTTLDSYVSTVRAYTFTEDDTMAAIKQAEKALKGGNTKLTTKGDDSLSPRLAAYFQYMPYIMLAVIIGTLCPLLITLGRKDLRFRTNCSCIKSRSYSLQLLAGSALFVLGLWLLFMIVGMIMTGGAFTGNALTAMLNSFIFALVTGSIAMVICSFDLDVNMMNLVSQVVGLGMSFFCGIFVPQKYLGEGVLGAARFMPAYWYIRVNDMLCAKQHYVASDVIKSLLIEAGFAVLFIVLSLLLLKTKFTRASKSTT